MGDPGGIGQDADAGLSPGTRLGKYEIIRLLGAGGMGAVYEASHTEIGKRVAIKVLSLAIAAVPGARARFLREAQLTSRVRHPNIVDVTDMGSDAGQTYLVMEFLRGEDLSQRLGRTGPLSPQELADVMLPVCSAVVEAHKAGITHRDLKPQNIFLAVGPHTTQPKVLDFGISKGNDIGGPGTLTGTGAMIGTPFYLAPEQIMDTRAAGPASDQYALGVIMYECLTGQRPFEAENLFVVFQAIVAGKSVPPGELRRGIPATLEAVVLRAMSVDPKARFSSTVALGRALLPFASPRMRSIWEDAFPAVDDHDDHAEQAATAGLPMTDSTQDPVLGVAPVASPMASGAGLPPATPTRGTAVMPMAAVAESERSEVSHGLPGRPPFRTNTRRGIAIVGVVVSVGLLAGVALRRSRSDSGARVGVGVAGVASLAARPSAASTNPVSPVTVAGSGATKVVAVAKPTSTPEPLQEPLQEPLHEPPQARVVLAPETFQVSFSVQPDTATIQLDGEMVGQGRFQRELPLDHTRHRVRLTADGYDDRDITFTDHPPPAVLKLTRARPAAAAAREDSGARSSTSAVRPVHRVRTQQDSPGMPAAPARRSLNPNGAPVID